MLREAFVVAFAAVDIDLGTLIEPDDLAVTAAGKIGVGLGEAAVDHVALKVDVVGVAIRKLKDTVVTGIQILIEGDGHLVHMQRVIARGEHVLRAVEDVVDAIAPVVARARSLAAYVGNGIELADGVIGLGLRRKRGNTRPGES